MKIFNIIENYHHLSCPEWKVYVIGVFLVRMQEITDQELSEYGYFSRSVALCFME